MMRRLHHWFCFFLLASVCGMSNPAPASADVRDDYEALTFTNEKGEKLLYRLLKPAAYDSTKKYPLVIFLHGAGERGDDNTKQLVHGMADFSKPETREKYPAFVIAPQCPEKQKWVDVDWSTTQHDMPDQAAPAMRLTMELLAQLQQKYSIDSQRLYITGLSMGGYGTWDALQRYPGRFAAAIPICGGGDPKHVEKFKQTPLWAFHGDQDTAVKPERSRQMIAALRAAGGMPKYTEYAGVGHDSWTATYKNPEVLAWLFAQVKK